MRGVSKSRSVGALSRHSRPPHSGPASPRAQFPGLGDHRRQRPWGSPGV